ncbi:MAG: hypothetical protein ACFWTZ_04170 [Burkholderia sp.]|jgi:MarR family transcriptional regulator, organic hydroperoxide resistance regulator
MTAMSESKIVFLSGRLSAAARDFLQRALEEEGYGDMQTCYGDVLVRLYERDGLTVTELARRSHRTKSTVSVLVDRLVAMGMVEKRASESDARAVGVWLTAKGEAFRAVMERISDRLNERLLKGFTAAERTRLEYLLEMALANL